MIMTDSLIIVPLADERLKIFDYQIGCTSPALAV